MWNQAGPRRSCTGVSRLAGPCAAPGRWSRSRYTSGSETRSRAVCGDYARGGIRRLYAPPPRVLKRRLALERGVVVVGAASDLVVLAGDTQAAGYPLDALRVGGHALLHVFGQHADQLEGGLRVGNPCPRLLPLKPDAGHDLVRSQASG